MIKDSGKKLFDVVLVWKFDRFARNRFDSANYKMILKKNGVHLISVMEPIAEGSQGILVETLVEGGEACTCGNQGCAEAYCSASALAREGARAMQARPDSLLAEKSGGRVEAVDAKLVVDCARAGDETAKNVFSAYLRHLASACASIFNLLDPEVLAIGGGLSGAGDLLFAPLQELVNERCFYHAAHGALVPAQLGNDAGMIGAAKYFMDREAERT